MPYMIVGPQGSDQADEWHRLGVEAQLTANGLTDPAARNAKLAEAQQRYIQALRLDPRHALATQNLAIVFAQSNLLNEGLLTIERAAMMDGVHGVIKMNWALMALESERIDEALAAARAAVELAPNDVPTLLALAMAVTTAGMPNEALPIYNRILDLDPKHQAAGPNSCFVGTLTDSTPAELLKQRQRWHAANRYDGKILPHKNDRDPDRPIRVGYVGGDFKCHSAAFIFSNILLHHTAAVEMYLYSTLPVDATKDFKTKKFQSAVNHGLESGIILNGKEYTKNDSRWRDISTMSDEDADAMIRRDKIDILVDLAAHTNGGRLTLFTRKPAPIQVTAWGFAHGTGCPEIDYFFADPIAIPESERQYYAEKIVDLPCIVTMEPPTEYNLKGVSQPPIRKNGVITFGCYARYEKMSDECLKTYAEILRRIPDARMDFKDGAYRRPYSIRRIYSLMPDIAKDRLLFSIATNHPDHMLSYQQSDICLDPWPHGGGVVSLEQLFMGVPLITLYGKQPSGRSASSVLTAMGRMDWIAKTPEEYIEIAVRLADDPKTGKLRQTLRDEFLASPVVAGYSDAVERKYREIWQEWCNR